MSPILKIIYTIFLGLMVALFIGMGIAAFYESPKAPDHPIVLDNGGKTETVDQKVARVQFEAEQKTFQEKFSVYNRNVFIIGLICAVIVLMISLAMTAFLKDLSDGILLGGVFTLLYSIIRGIMSENSQFRFLAVSVGLILALFLGYLKLNKSVKK